MSAERSAERHLCRCGHFRSRHRRAWGPNSIGQHGFGLCIFGWKVTHGYVFDHGGACKCESFRRKRWWHRTPGAHPMTPQHGTTYTYRKGCRCGGGL